MINAHKTCFWHRVYPGTYKLGDITVERLWHSKGVYRGTDMWHVIIDCHTVISWAYLKNAKQSAYKIDHYVKQGITDPSLWELY